MLFGKTEQTRNGVKNKTIYSLFEEMARKVPYYPAITYKDETMSYAELSNKVNSLAAGLRMEKVKKQDIVALMMGRSIDVIAGMLAILKVGAAYLPIDPEYPGRRKNYMLTDSRATFLLTQSGLEAAGEYVKVLYIDELCAANPEYNENECEEPQADDLAYIIYTSGSTGQAKGVMIEHKSVVNFFNGMAEVIDFAEGKKILALTTISFDIFVLEALLPLTRGLTVVIAEEEMQNNPRLLADFIPHHDIDMLQATPSMMRLLASCDNKPFECLRGLKEIMIGGEAFPQSLLDPMRRKTNAKIYNLYGPTETTIWSTVSDVTAKNDIDIGEPILNTQVYIMDERDHTVPAGEEGELCIGGDGLARGYAHRPELTAERFVANPFVPGERMYKTGDRVKLLPDGNLQYLGRIDNQVKIRGHRIEVEEVEGALMEHPYIQQAAVASWQDQENNKYLCAYVIAEHELHPGALREFLSHSLPDYMIPSYFIRLDHMPYTLNGKIDRKALPLPEKIQLANEGHVPDRAGEDPDVLSKIKAIIRANAEIALPREEIGPHSHLSDLGIHSITFIKMIVALETAFDFEFPSEDIDAAKYVTVQDVVAYVESKATIKN
ncbi:non-ribosomal peptide synthetase [Paenibacillus thiaminolyticus]|uniref:non-ribosomal peptide synthetase n=1 Tax=Paenibacillus thiaminolyticus TaxID=49283 RepID=UPI001163BD16|nr:amino acid adenylation domain-containing protein [Paenibacillus thiaminolyticus]NGP62436.1 non-ribosomal peptide synthetase [Paenibacillus thiaminolyticus]